MDWEISDADVRVVLEKHGKDSDEGYAAAEPLIFDKIGRIFESAICYDDSEDQVIGAHDEIENILIENDILQHPKQFVAP